MSVSDWDTSYPPSLWAPPPPPPLATGATAGSPGAWTPSGSSAPTSLAEANAIGYSGAAWAAGSWVDLADGTDVYWDGLAFVAGIAPVVEDPEPEAEAAPTRRARKRTDDEG